MNLSRKLTVLGIGVALIALKADIPAQAFTITYGGNSTGAPTFNRPDDNLDDSPPRYLSVFATAVPYQAQSFFVDTSKSYDFLGNAPNFDQFFVLYENTFNPNDPLTNALRANDDFNGLDSGFSSVPLLANTQYFLVTTGYRNDSFGDYTNSITTSDGDSAPGTITLGTTTPAAAVPFELSPGLGSIGLAVCGAIAYFKGNKKSKTFAKILSKD